MHAQESATSSARPGRIVVGLPPGQATDIVARVLAEELSRKGRPWIIENRPGQGGSLALGVVARAPADGSVAALGATAAYSINPHIYKTVPYDTLRDFAPVGLVVELPFVLLVHPSNPATSLLQLLAQARQSSQRMAYSSSGNGTLSHLLMEDLRKRAGLELTHVPYAGSARALTDLAGGSVQLALDTLGAALPLIRGGRLKLIAVGTQKRLRAFPDTPTIAEPGFSGFDAVAWIGLTLPAGTPTPMREGFNAQCGKLSAGRKWQHASRRPAPFREVARSTNLRP